MNDLREYLGETDYNPTLDLVRSVYTTDTEILQGIIQLHNAGQPFDCDPSFSKGVMWKELTEPRLKFDIEPQRADVQEANSNQLPLASNSIESIVFDPPFMFGNHGQQKNYIMTTRFTRFDSWQELEDMYQDSLQEFHRILKPKGIVAFKCQDHTDSKTVMTHCYVWKWAEEIGFYAKDIFIKEYKGGRMYNPAQTQRHARKFHCYWWVFEKK